MQRTELHEIVVRLGANYGKHPNWAAEVVEAWERKMRTVEGHILAAAVEDWVAHEDHPPKLSDLVKACDRQQPAGQGVDGAHGCKDCDFLGWRTGVRMRAVGGIETRAAPCSCAKGVALAAAHQKPGPHAAQAVRSMPWTRLREVWTQDPGTLAMAFSSYDVSVVEARRRCGEPPPQLPPEAAARFHALRDRTPNAAAVLAAVVGAEFPGGWADRYGGGGGRDPGEDG